jgi:diadenosine tetraphosphatase ApaH/serine/threonine PP2A family protein phosphatase
MKRTIVIGDLHGCYHEALNLLDKLAVSQNDRVIFAGDMVDRGPHSRECVDLAMQYEAILGNHEETQLYRRFSKPEKLTPDHLNTRNQLEAHHYDYFHSLPLFIRLPEYNAAVVHAGVYPGLALEQQPAYLLLHGQCISPHTVNGQPHFKSYWSSKAPDGYTFWVNHWQGPERIIFGHTVLNKPLVSEWAVGIDTGAVFGRGLTAVVLPDWEIVTVPSKRYSDKRAKNEHVKLFPVMGGVSAFS